MNLLAINQLFETFFVVTNRDYKDWVLITLNILFSNNANTTTEVPTIEILIYYFIKYSISDSYPKTIADATLK